ncbi:MAG: DUF3379 family protein [Pseudomonadota bacterium]
MNCIEHRRELNTDPVHRSPAARAHEVSCAQCRVAADQAMQFEAELQAALRVEPPESLKAKLLTRNQPRPIPVRRRTRGWAAAAAIGMIAIAITLWPTRPSLNEEIVQLIQEAAFAMAATGPVPPEDLTWTLNRVSLDLEGSPGEASLGTVRFAGHCLVRKKLAGHLVIEGKRAPVTIFLMPDEHTTKRQTFTSSFMRGVIIPVATGSIALVGAHGESLAAIEKQMLNNINWQGWQRPA